MQIQSMTGFGQAVRCLDGLTLAVDIKTVNSRYLDVNPRLPRELAAHEAEIRKLAQAKFKRGRVDIFLNLATDSSDQYAVNEALVESYQRSAERMEHLGFGGQLNIASLLQLPGVLVPKQLDCSSAEFSRQMLSTVMEAVDQVIAVRIAEGAALRKELDLRLKSLAEIVAKIELESRGMTEHYRRKLTTRIGQLGEEGVVDQSRLAQEVLFYSERSDISEEIQRLVSHNERFCEIMDSSEASIGKTLDFLCQEMNREMNTVLSKAALAQMSALAVEGKGEIERLREQVQNVE